MKESDRHKKASLKVMYDALAAVPVSDKPRSDLTRFGDERMPNPNTLTEQDAERLEKVGFQVGETIGNYDEPRFKFVRLRDHAGMHNHNRWLIHKYIDDALIGILVGMAWKKGWEICWESGRNLYATVLIEEGCVYIRLNATPRQIFDALMDVLEATDGTID